MESKAKAVAQGDVVKKPRDRVLPSRNQYVSQDNMLISGVTNLQGLHAKQAPLKRSNMSSSHTEPEDERLASCDPLLIEKIEHEILHRGDKITFDDIAGLQFVKKTVKELVCW